MFQVSQQVQQAQEQVTTDLKTELTTLKQQYDAAQSENQMKEKKISQLIRDIHNLVNNKIKCGYNRNLQMIIYMKQ